jgi:hypothetical protein
MWKLIYEEQPFYSLAKLHPKEKLKIKKFSKME